MLWARARRGPELFVLLMGGSLFLCSAWFFIFPSRLSDSWSGASTYDASYDNYTGAANPTHAADPKDIDQGANAKLSPSPFAPKPALWDALLNRTHDALLAAHLNYTAKLGREALCSANESLRLPAASRPRRWVDQTRSLDWLFQRKVSPTVGDDGVQLLTCAHFDPACAHWTDQALIDLYDLTYVPPDFAPSIAEVRKYYEEPAVMNAAQAGRHEDVKRQRMVVGNTGLPQVAVLLDGFVTPRGSIVSRDFYIPCSIDVEHLDKDGVKAGFPSTYEFLACNKEKVLPKLIEVREVAVIYHLHHDMFYHLVQDQYYRLLTLLPYLRQHPEIYIYIYGWPSDSDDSFGSRFFQFCGIPKSRVIYSGGGDSDVSVKADVIYYVQEISRQEPSALGSTQQLRSQFWNLLALPNHRPWSALLEPAKREPVEAFFNARAVATPPVVPGYAADHPLEVNLLVIVRKDHWRGRMVVNQEEMKTALLELATTFPADLLKRAKAAEKKSEGKKDERTGVVERYIKINYKEHYPTTPLPDTLALYAQADFVIGPHGAGFVFLAATKPGAHVVEFVGGYEQNMMTTARLGSAYHGVAANLTKEGITKGSNSFDYHVDVPHLVGLVTSALESRFLVGAPPASKIPVV